MLSRKQRYQKRSDNSQFPKNKTFSYRSARRNPGGSDSSDNSAMKPTDEQNKRKSSGKLSKAINATIIAAVFSSLAYLSYIQTDPVIKLDQKTIPRNENDYYDVVNKEMSTSFLYKNKLTFDTKKFSAEIKAEFPEVDSVIVEIPVFRHRPTVNIVLSEPSARLVTNDKSYILDKEGRALFPESQINDQFDTSRLVSINDASGHPVVLGKPVLTEQQINYIKEVINQSNANDTSAQIFDLEFGGSAVDIKFQDVSYLVRFSFYEDPKQSSGAYFAIREEINKGHVPTPEKYIDLRIPDRAYLK